jgi:hypothetical protein
MKNKFEITAKNTEDFNRTLKTIEALFTEDIRIQIFDAKISEELLTVQFGKLSREDAEDLILPFPDEYSGELRKTEFILQMIAEKHVGEPIYPPKKIIFKYVDGSDLNFIVFKKVKFT